MQARSSSRIRVTSDSIVCGYRRTYRKCGLLLASAARNSMLIAAMESAAAAALSARGSRGGKSTVLMMTMNKIHHRSCSPHNKSRIQEDAGAAPHEHKNRSTASPTRRTSPAGVPLYCRRRPDRGYSLLSGPCRPAASSERSAIAAAAGRHAGSHGLGKIVPNSLCPSN